MIHVKPGFKLLAQIPSIYGEPRAMVLDADHCLVIVTGDGFVLRVLPDGELTVASFQVHE